MENIFREMEEGFRNKNESLVRKHWTEKGYEETLVENSGLSGARLYQQGSNKGWFPKPDFSKNIINGNATIVETQIWSWEKQKSVDEIYLLLRNKDGDLKIVGGGENLEEVKELAEEYK